MLLAQPFEPLDHEPLQPNKMPFLARCKFLTQRTKRALCSLKNRTHNTTRRGFPAIMFPDNRFILTPPQARSWYSGHGGCYDPYLMLGPPPPHPMHFPPMPLHQSMPYSICVHLTTSCPSEKCNNQLHHHSKSRKHQQRTHENSSSTGSTLCNEYPSSFNDDEKEQIEYDFPNDESALYVKRKSLTNIAATPSTLSRSNSDIIHNRNQQHQQRRSYLQHRSISQVDMYNYD